jgi:hypothetical protein
MRYIEKISSEDTGGGMIVEMIQLKDGRCLGINDECVVLYPNYEALFEATGYMPTINLIKNVPESKPQHTLGPWETRYSLRNNYWFIEHEEAGEGLTLTKLDCKEADARLIAAAPELLAAVEDLLDVMDMKTDAQKEFSKQTQEVIDAAYAAIAKATGEKS